MEFMKGYIAGRPAPAEPLEFQAPGNIVFQNVDRAMGSAPEAQSSSTINEAFISGTQPGGARAAAAAAAALERFHRLVEFLDQRHRAPGGAQNNLFDIGVRRVRRVDRLEHQLGKSEHDPQLILQVVPPSPGWACHSRCSGSGSRGIIAR